MCLVMQELWLLVSEVTLIRLCTMQFRLKKLGNTRCKKEVCLLKMVRKCNNHRLHVHTYTRQHEEETTSTTCHIAIKVKQPATLILISGNTVQRPKLNTEWIKGNRKQIITLYPEKLTIIKSDCLSRNSFL